MSLLANAVGHRYKNTETDVLTNITLEIHDGESVALLGPSGSGKSTLLGILGLLHSPSKGSVTVDGHNTHERGAIDTLRTQMGWIIQGSNLLGSRSALDNVVLSELGRGANRAAAERQAIIILTRVGLAHRIDAQARLLSGGEAQRASIARAFLGSPRWVFADEPTGQLDQSTTKDIIDAVLHARADTTALIVATHDQHLAQRCDRIFELVDGHLRQQ